MGTRTKKPGAAGRDYALSGLMQVRPAKARGGLGGWAWPDTAAMRAARPGCRGWVPSMTTVRTGSARDTGIERRPVWSAAAVQSTPVRLGWALTWLLIFQGGWTSAPRRPQRSQIVRRPSAARLIPFAWSSMESCQWRRHLRSKQRACTLRKPNSRRFPTVRPCGHLRMVRTTKGRLLIHNNEDFGFLTIGALERTRVLIRLLAVINANEPHRHVAARTVRRVERRWRMSCVLCTRHAHLPLLAGGGTSRL